MHEGDVCLKPSFAKTILKDNLQCSWRSVLSSGHTLRCLEPQCKERMLSAQVVSAVLPIVLNTNCVLVLYRLEPELIDVINACILFFLD